MELRILHQKVKSWAASGITICLGLILLLSACQGAKRYLNSKGYEIIYYSPTENADDNSVLVHGRVTISETGKNAAFATLHFESKKGKIYETKADKNGFYSVRLKEKYFNGTVTAKGRGSSYIIEDMFFSDACEFNIRLFNYDKPGNFVELTKSDLIFIKDEKAREDSLKMHPK